MTGRNRRNFSPEFRLEADQLVLDQYYTVAAAATAINRESNSPVGARNIAAMVTNQKRKTEPLAGNKADGTLLISQFISALLRVDIHNKHHRNDAH